MRDGIPSLSFRSIRIEMGGRGKVSSNERKRSGESSFICERIPSRSMIYLRCRVRKCASRLATIRLNFVNSKVFEREMKKRAYRCENVFQRCSGEKLFTRNGWSIFSALIVEILITCRILFCLIVQEAIDKTSRWNVVKWNVLSLTSSNRSLHLTLPRFSSTLTAARVSNEISLPPIFLVMRWWSQE